MANLKNVRINPETGNVEYYFPMELTSETERDFRDLIKCKHYQTGWAKLGNREFKAVFIPVTEEQYRDLIKDELREQDEKKWADRCVISDGRGDTKLCPRQVPNPAYVTGGPEPKTIINHCENCPCYQSYSILTGRLALFSELSTIDENGEPIDYDPASPKGYYGADRYEELCQEFVDYVRENRPQYASLADLLVHEYSQAEAAKELAKADSTINSQVQILRELVSEFLKETDNLS